MSIVLSGGAIVVELALLVAVKVVVGGRASASWRGAVHVDGIPGFEREESDLWIANCLREVPLAGVDELRPGRARVVVRLHGTTGTSALLQALVDEDKIPMKEQNVSNAVEEEGEQVPAGPPGDRIGQLSENLIYAVRLTTIDNRDKFPVNSGQFEKKFQ